MIIRALDSVFLEGLYNWQCLCEAYYIKSNEVVYSMHCIRVASILAMKIQICKLQAVQLDLARIDSIWSD